MRPAMLLCVAALGLAGCETKQDTGTLMGAIAGGVIGNQFGSGSGRVVQVLDAQGNAQDVPVEIGITDGSKTEIISGVQEGQQILAIPGSDRLNAPPNPFGG